jgi:nicotinamidase-related amidase
MGDSSGHAFEHQHSALVIIDMINDLDFEGGQALLQQAVPICAAVARLRHWYRAHGYPVIYANDNFGRWQADFDQVIEHSRRDGARGARLSDELLPDERDYYILKPRHSAFYQTPMSILLRKLGIGAVALVGIAGDDRVLRTAMDAQMREYAVWVPADGVASQSAARNQRALQLLHDVAGADITEIVVHLADSASTREHST